MNKTSYFYINGPFYIFEVDNVIIIYNLYNDLLLSLQLETYNNNNITAKEMIFKNQRRIVFSTYRGRSLSELTQQDERGKKTANLMWQAWQWFCLKKASAKLHLLLNSFFFCKRLEKNNVKWRSRKKRQVTALSLFSLKSGLSSSSCCCDVKTITCNYL